jgi:hypothetical protein
MDEDDALGRTHTQTHNNHTLCMLTTPAFLMMAPLTSIGGNFMVREGGGGGGKIIYGFVPYL